jgi:predicted transcriptional regulator
MEAERPRRASGELEADVLAALWRADRALSPGEVREQVPGDLAYTTVMTILSRLHDKGVLDRERVGRAYHYTPSVDAAELAASRMRDLLDKGHDRDAVLTRFVRSLSSSDEKTLLAALRRATRRTID